MIVKIDPETCSGCSLCADICADVFKMDDDLAVVHTNPVPEGAESDCRDAVEQCPVEAITSE